MLLFIVEGLVLLCCHPPTENFRSVFNDSIATKMALGGYDGKNRALSQVFVGKTKELMDLVDPDLEQLK